jgi:formylglycine-generating enzyme required for sulfatase activity
MRMLPILKTRRVLRGGSWNNSPQILRSANRNWITPDDRGDGTGFRIARTF